MVLLIIGDTEVGPASTTIHGSVNGFAAELNVVWVFENENPGTLASAKLALRKPGHVRVNSCSMEMDGVLVNAVVMAKSAARATYTDAVSKGKKAGLVNESDATADVFIMEFGNVAGGTAITVRMALAASVEVEPSGARLVCVPCELGHHGGSHRDGNEIALRLTFPDEGLVSVSSLTHPDTSEVAKGSVTHTKSLDGRDFVLRLQYADPYKLQVFVETSTSMLTTAVVLYWHPRLCSTFPCPLKELVFVVDCSGSMQGWKITSLIRVMHVMLSSMALGQPFNIVAFGTMSRALFPEGSRVFDDDTLFTARAFVNGLAGNMGGTEILPALQAYALTEPHVGLLRDVFLITDGEVSNTREVVSACKAAYANWGTRCFTAGLGSQVSTQLLREVAAGTNATSFLVPTSTDDNLTALAVAQISASKQAPLKSLTTQWRNDGVVFTASSGSGLGLGSTPVVFGGVFKTESVRAHPTVDVTITAEFYPTGTLQWKVSTPLETDWDVPRPAFLHKDVAYMKLAELPEDDDGTTAFAVEWQLMSKSTALVAVRPEDPGVIIGNLNEAGGAEEYEDDEDDDSLPDVLLCLGSSSAKACDSSSSSSEDSVGGAGGGLFGGLDDDDDGDDFRPALSEVYELIMRRMTATGLWSLALFSTRYPVQVTTLLTARVVELPETANANLVWGTVFVLTLLRSVYEDKKAEWSLLQDKATAALMGAVNQDAAMVEAMLEFARRLDFSE